MEFFLLGPLLVFTAARAEIRVPAGKQRILLAVLLLHPNRVVSADILVEALWGGEPPPSATAAMRNYVKRLRSTLNDADHDLIRHLHTPHDQTGQQMQAQIRPRSATFRYRCYCAVMRK